MRKITEWVLDLLYPRRCIMCDTILMHGESDICRSCKTEVQIIGDPYCMKCGKMLEQEEAEWCRDCQLHPHVFERGRSLFLYEGRVKKSLYLFKYGGRKEYAKAYAALAKQWLGEYIRKIQPQALVPVPLHRKRYRVRGYNQSEVFAKELGRRMGIPVASKLVQRVKNTLPQKELALQERQNNLKKAFKISENDVKLDTIIIIDDIYTTGSTMDALSAALKESGVRSVYFLTISGGR